MSRISAHAVLAPLTLVIYTTAIADKPDTHSQTLQNFYSLPLYFTENQGQWDARVKFRANAGGATMWFAPDGAYYQFTRRIGTKIESPFSAIGSQFGLTPDDMADRKPDSIETMMIKASFVGANQNPQMIGADLTEYKCNYFIGNDANEWHTDVPNYTAVMYQEIYDGIDLKYYGNGRQMEYDFIVSPGADFSQIKIQYEGAESISTNANGDLVIKTNWGEVIEKRPVIYQQENNTRIPVDGRYLITGANSFGFELSGYNSALPVIIDPVLVYSTYLGGRFLDDGYGIAVDASGCAYITGETGSANFPTLAPGQTAFQGIEDAFVTKLNRSGSGLVYSSYLGGTSLDGGADIAVDTSGAAYVTGRTYSPDFPMRNPFQGTFQGGNGDAFVTKLSPSGSSLIYSTYIGGTGGDASYGITVIDYGEAFLVGNTSSNDFPTLDPYQESLQGFSDAFVTKFSSTGSSLVYSTYLGGSGSDGAYGVKVDASGAAYITGYTMSIDFPTLNPYQKTLQGILDVFVTKLSPSGAGLIYSTYLGGNRYDRAFDIAIDNSGAAYITGSTESTNFPTVKPIQDSLRRNFQGSTDGFVSKLSSSGDSLIYSTYLGGGNLDYGAGIAVDAYGAAYVTGTTGSHDFPAQNPFQVPLNWGDNIFLARFSPSGESFSYSLHFGTWHSQQSFAFTIDEYGAAYITGRTFGLIPTLNAFQDNYQGGDFDSFVSKFSGPSCCITPGDFNNDGSFNIADVTAGIARIFTGGPAPVCLEQADSNGDNAFNIADLTYSIASILAVGPDPICGAFGE